MRNITTIITQAILTNNDWPIISFFEAIEKLSKNGLEISYWKDEENWASIITDNNVVGYIWSKHPLIFIISQHTKIVKQQLKDYPYLFFIEVNSLTEKAFQLNYDELKDEIDFGLSKDGFSAEDLWFYTNT